MLGFSLRLRKLDKMLKQASILAGSTPSTSLPTQQNTEYFAVRVARIELASQPWEGRILPLYHTRFFT